jgi:hypothetical protein
MALVQVFNLIHIQIWRRKECWSDANGKLGMYTPWPIDTLAGFHYRDVVEGLSSCLFTENKYPIHVMSSYVRCHSLATR